ncbi:putative lipoprotein [Streptomyces sp. NBRC 14336]|uniref:hypothetical protein n=1 Tax=Streptomyces sp. NBRC 14336 TaxID=3030992 RepID=UPI0024A3D77C|nr:hypothetical protein [Streptomyces sp. NBRC 14336]WBO78104.1 hypothetical protein SBE_001678 [Streptomyces sp. SBE_14.2]GLW45509.1 putative lipoprotein [Streptomyces sp. NBRC 14336]
MKLRHTTAWVGLAAAALVATTACGSDAAKKTTEKAAEVSGADKIMAALARATDRTEKLGSAEVTMSTDLGTGTPIAMEGTYSWGDGMAYDIQMDTKAAQMEALQDDPTIHCLLVDGVYYYDVDPQASGPIAGKEWIKIDSSAVFGESGSQAYKNSGSGAGNPTASLKGLKYASDVEDLGSETVNGQQATHYRAVLDQNDMGQFKDAYSGEDSLLGDMTGGATTMTMDIWVNDKDLPVRLKQVMGTMKVTMDFDKFGATKDITTPPAAQTADLTEAVKEQNGQ